MTRNPAIELRQISKSFGPVQANKDINISVMPGTIHGIIGENGAGKSTLMSILYGFYKADAGEIFVDGKKISIPDSQAAIAAGIGMVFQHFKLVENFSVLENIVLGAESGALLAPSLSKARTELAELASEYELNVDPDAIIEDIGVGMQQRVEILKALYRQANILILDEPTGVLTPAEADQLFRILKRLREEGKTIILITHKLREIMDITDTVSVMRQGEMTATLKTDDTSPEDLAELMVGRKVLLRVDKTTAKPTKPVLEVQNLSMIDDFGVQRLKNINLIMDFMAWENAVFGYHREKTNQANKFFMDNNAIRKETEEKMKRFDVRPPNPKLTAKNFSGGNQQKIVLAREIERNPDLLLVGQPTRGVDIGAIEFIHQQIVALRDQGKAILLISVELDEILSLSDRVLVMFDGEIMGERQPANTNEKELGLLMAGVSEKAAQ